MALFHALLGQGVRLKVTAGCNLKEVLTDQIGLDPDYIENRIQTIFVNGHPIDDIERTGIDAGAAIALSAAMPGLAGATLRRGGHLAVMRRSISQDASDSSKSGTVESLITLKLFNMVAREMGPTVLARGIWLTGEETEDLIHRMVAAQQEPIADIRRDGMPRTIDQLLSGPWPKGWVVLYLKFS